ncbi:TPA: hypothetical protein ACQ39K_004119 [Yersinia enterocolitica]
MMTGYQLFTSSTSYKRQTVVDTLNLRLAAGEWEETLQQFTEHYKYQDLLAWLVHFPLSDEANCVRCLNDMRRWITSPEEGLRWQIFTQAQAIGFNSAVGVLGLSLFWSQGSMTAADLEPVYPQPHLAGLMLLNALKLTCVQLTGDGELLHGTHILLNQWFSQYRGDN